VRFHRTTRDTAEESGDLVGDQQFVEINLFRQVTRRRLWIACADTLIVEVEGAVFSDGDLLKLQGLKLLKDEHPASENKKANEVSCLRNTRQTLQKLTMKTSHPASQKQSTPPIFASVAGCLPDEPSEEGVRLSRTSKSNLTTWTEETKNPASHDEN